MKTIPLHLIDDILRAFDIEPDPERIMSVWLMCRNGEVNIEVDLVTDEPGEEVTVKRIRMATRDGEAERSKT